MDQKKINEIKNVVKNILSGIRYDGKEMVNTQACLDYIEIIKKIDIKVYKISFKDLKKELEDFGAMMVRTKGVTRNIARIYLNSDKDPVFQRFSLMHEFGHILFDEYTTEDFKDKLVVSSHINYRLFSIPDSDTDKNKYLQREQYANIFALELLMPSTKIKELKKVFSDDEMSVFFGVDKVAVKTRLDLLAD
ncbi:MAG: ImmA/IrrE family metallo-endopeptidase [Erysipelotrichales bacterium]|nr:ImmA/IrrE family metallo-endopeptidase [Erysipelotrichales bacterium]